MGFQGPSICLPDFLAPVFHTSPLDGCLTILPEQVTHPTKTADLEVSSSLFPVGRSPPPGASALRSPTIQPSLPGLITYYTFCTRHILTPCPLLSGSWALTPYSLPESLALNWCLFLLVPAAVLTYILSLAAPPPPSPSPAFSAPPTPLSHSPLIVLAYDPFSQPSSFLPMSSPPGHCLNSLSSWFLDLCPTPHTRSISSLQVVPRLSLY